MSRSLFKGLLLTLLFSASTLAQAPEMSRDLGADGVPVITIKGHKPPAVKDPSPAEPQVIAPRKEFKVYELDGEPSQSKNETKIVVISSPPPIAPSVGNYGFGWGGGWGWGFPPGPGFFGPGAYCGPRFHGSQALPGLGFNGRSGYFSSYVNPPVNYQNPPINYQNPPANYRPITPNFNRLRR